MSLSSIPVDLFNAGQVFACLGLLEAADTLLQDAVGAFDWADGEKPRFCLFAPGECDPVRHIMEFLAGAQVHSECPHGSINSTARWEVPTIELPDGSPFPFPDPDSPATLPAILQNGNRRLVLDHWGEGRATGRDSVKFWGGAAGFPGAGLAQTALNAVRDRCISAVSDPFNLSAPQSNSFRFDWRRDYIPIDAGFSLNRHDNMQSIGYPVVELLAAVGLSHARPSRTHRFNKLDYRYEILGALGAVSETSAGETLYPPALLRAALGGTNLPFPRRRFRLQLGWPAKEGQFRSITSVTEEALV